MVPIRSYQHGNDQIDVGAGPICNCVVRDQRFALPVAVKGRRCVARS